MQAFDGNRIESRFQGTTPPLGALPASVIEPRYDQGVNNSLYFATTTDLSNISRGHGVLRLRFRSQDTTPPDERVQFIDPNQVAALEAKLRGTAEGAEPSHHAVSKCLLGIVTVGEAVERLRSPERHKWLRALAGGDDPEVGDRLDWLFDDEPLTLLNVSQMRRRHFYTENARVTHDTDVSFWVAHNDPYVRQIYALRSTTMPRSVVEVKSSQENGELSTGAVGALLCDIFGQGHDYRPSHQPKSSTAMATMRRLGIPYVLNHEVHVTNDATHIIEREQKFAVASDPRKGLTYLDGPGSEKMHITSPEPTNTYFRIFRLGNYFVKEVSPAADFENSEYRYKEPKPVFVDSEGTIVRRKHKVITFEALCKQLGVPASTEVSDVTPPAQRARATVFVTLKDTGNRFAVIADHCTRLDTGDALNQVEIEYLGRFGFQEEAKLRIDPRIIADDSARILAVLNTALTEHSLRATPTTLSKQDWLQPS